MIRNFSNRSLIMVLLLSLLTQFNSLKAEQVDSLIWALLKNKVSPIDLNLIYAKEWQRPKNLDKVYSYKGTVINSESWTFPIIAATKITAFKQELNNYSDRFIGNTGEDLAAAQLIFAAYGVTFGGNYDEHWLRKGDSLYEIAKAQTILALKDNSTKNKVWDFMEPALKYQLKTMELKSQGVVVSTFEYVRDYFGPAYDLEKAKNWYLKDTETKQFASKDYLGQTHAARKITAFIERCMFKHQILSLDEVRKWLEKIGKWLQEVLGSDYLAAKNYWMGVK